MQSSTQALRQKNRAFILMTNSETWPRMASFTRPREVRSRCAWIEMLATPAATMHNTPVICS